MGENAVIDFWGTRIPFALHYEGTKRFFGKYLSCEEASPGTACVQLDKEFLCRQIQRFPEHTPQDVEYNFLVGDSGNELLRHGFCLLHGVAFVFRGRAVILTGPSGIGKSTQYMNWKKLFPEEIQIINGDKILLKKQDDGIILAGSSPWFGKEGFHSEETAVLGGIVCLRQRKENGFRKLPVSASAGSLYRQIMYAPYMQADADRACAFLTDILESTPVWAFGNTGDMASTEYLRECLTEIAEKMPSGGPELKPGTEKTGLHTEHHRERRVEHSGQPRVCIRPDVVLERICGEHALVSLWSARKICPPVMMLNETAAFFWQSLVGGKTFEEVYSGMERRFSLDNITREKVFEDYRAFQLQLQKYHYLTLS